MLAVITGFAVRRPVIVLMAWLVAVVLGFGVGLGVFDRLVSDAGSVPGSESDVAMQRLADAPPEPERLTAIIHGRSADDPAVRGSVAAAITDVRGMPGIAEVSEPVPSTTTGNALLVGITLRPGDSEAAAAEAVAERLHRIDAPAVVVAGGPLSRQEFNGQAQQDVARAEMLSTPIVLILLLLIFGGLIAAGLPLLVAVVGVGATFAILFAFSLVTDVSV